MGFHMIGCQKLFLETMGFVYVCTKSKNMNKIMLLLFLISSAISQNAAAQNISDKAVPSNVKAAFIKKYPEAKKVSWEKEKGNYEANWGGKTGEENAATFTPAADFVEIVNAIPVSALPASVATYVKAHYGKARIKEAGKVTDAKGIHMFEAEVKGKDLIFDENGVFLKEN